jgi:arylsulfatase
MPTLCEIAEVKYPAEYKGQKIIPCEGKSLAPVFQGKQRDGHEWLFWEAYGKRAVRHGKWKLVGLGNPEELNNWELYDLQTDRNELKNLSQKYPERVKQMSNVWCDWNEKRSIN